jgi:hypothetical protein
MSNDESNDVISRRNLAQKAVGAVAVAALGSEGASAQTPAKPAVKVDPKNVSVDEKGRVVIDNKEVSDHLKSLLGSGKAPNVSSDALIDVNFGC